MADDPAFKTKRDPHLTVDLLRQGWQGLKSKVPSLQKVEDWAEERSIPAAMEGALRAATPAEPWEVPLMGLGKAPKLAAVGAATLAGTSEAEAATPLQKTLFNLLRKHGGNVEKAQGELAAMRPTLPQGQRGPATQLATGELAPALVRREMMTNPDVPNVWDLMEGRRQQTLLTPEQAFKIGDTIVPVSGDTTHAGRMVKRAGIDLKTPVELQGGHEYGLASQGGAPWASEFGAANTKQKGFERAAETTPGDVLGVHVAMAPEGSHFAKHTPELWREMLRSGPGIAKEDIAGFGADVSTLLGSKQAQHLKKFGRESPMLAEALRNWKGLKGKGLDELLDINPEARKALMETGLKPGWQMRGFPDMDRLYGASLDETLRTGDVGGGVMRAAPGEPLRPSQHRTYGFDFPGEHLGRLETPIPAEMMFPEAAAAKGGSLLGSLRTAYWARPVDQKMIDDLSKYTEQQRLLRAQGF